MTNATKYAAIGAAGGVLVGALGSKLIKGKICLMCTIVATLALAAGGYFYGNGMTTAPTTVTK